MGVRAFMPASRSGVRDAAEIEKLVEQEIRCRIIKLDAAEEDVVVDRRVVAEEEEQLVKGRRYSEIKEGEKVTGTVRSLTDYGAFVDIGGVDALLGRWRIDWPRTNRGASRQRKRRDNSNVSTNVNHGTLCVRFNTNSYTQEIEPAR